MGHGSQNGRTFVHNPHASVAENILSFFRAKHGPKYVEQAAAALRISEATIRKMEQRNSCPSFMMIDRIGKVYGPEGVYALTGWNWLNESVRDAKRDALQSKIDMLRAEQANL